MSTTMTTLAGLQEQITADTTAMFRLSSDLFSTVSTVSAGSANHVMFSTREVPGVASVQVENQNVSPTVVSVDAITDSLKTYPILARASKLSLAAPDASLKIAQHLSGGIARTIDTLICSNFTNFSAVGGDPAPANLDAILAASAQLDNTGFIGEKIVVLNPNTWVTVGKQLLGFPGAVNKATEFMSRGYVASIGGIDIYVSPWASQNGLFFKEAIGLGYREPIIDIEAMPNLEKVAIDFLGTAFLVCRLLNDELGVKF